MSEDFNPTQHLIDVQGGAKYLPVAPRVQWFRKENKEATVETEIVSIDDKTVTFRAVVSLPNGARATGHARELLSGGAGSAKFNPVETCETSAIGRALAVLGYGTLDALGDEAAAGNRIVDSPAQRGSAPAAKPDTSQQPATEAQIKLVSGKLRDAGMTSDLIEERIKGLTRGEVTALLNQIKSGAVGGNGSPPATDADGKPASKVTQFWTRANALGLQDVKAVSAYLGRDISGESDFGVLLTSLNEKAKSVADGLPF